MSGEMIYHEDLRFELEGDLYKIQYNTSSSYNFHDLVEADIPMLKFINSFHVHRKDSRLHMQTGDSSNVESSSLVRMTIYAASLYIWCLYIPKYIAA